MDSFIINLDSKPDIPKIKELGSPIFFVTSSSIVRVSEIKQKLQSEGFDVSEDQIWTSSKISASFIAANHPECKKVRVVGEEPLFEEL